MNELLTSWITGIRQWFETRTPKQRGLLSLISAGIVVAAAIGTLISQHDPLQLLYSDLQPDEARAVAKKLAEGKIAHELSPDQTTVSVPTSQVAKARMELAKAGLPGQDVVGFEKFDGATLGMSSYVQRIQYVRAVQGELTRSIQQLSAVKKARVHISVPPKKTFLEDEDPPKASVVLELKRGQRPSKAEVNGIAHLVASAVEGLKVSHISIVDTAGNFLHRPEDAGRNGISTALLENQHAMETEYERRVEEILTPVVGMGKVRAKVAAEIDPARVNTTEESFDADKAAVRSTVRNEEVTQGSKPNPVGIPGSRSNLPGAEAANPPVPMANTSSEKNVQNTNYSIPRKIQVTDKPSGSLKRLTVAVIVDGYYQTVNGVETFSPRSDDELRRLQQLVANSVGFDEQRRDSITVSCLPFRNADVLPEDAPVVALPWWKTDALWKGGLVFLAALIPLVVGFWVLLRKRGAADTSSTVALAQGPKTVAQLEAEVLKVQKGEAAGQSSEEDETPPEKKEEIELRKKIIEKLGVTPKKGIAVVSEWLDEASQEELEVPAEAVPRAA